MPRSLWKWSWTIGQLGSQLKSSENSCEFPQSLSGGKKTLLNLTLVRHCLDIVCRISELFGDLHEMATTFIVSLLLGSVEEALPCSGSDMVSFWRSRSIRWKCPGANQCGIPVNATVSRSALAGAETFA
ncbi:hypothetical protein NPIL_494581 [Nephila pilipes]|uniref:Uncharacterized protein n=1 Tax=Nephila pilipes TaxID=299642 RepID=A0A8X6TN72_NEPPI|nr:hypothetical protein NPIL_494581 [Nephila pilipes]